MNDKEKELYKILDAVVECCATQIDDAGTMSLSREDIIGPSRTENVVMTRCIVTHMIISAGYSITTVAQLLRRTNAGVRKLERMGHDYWKTSKAYRIAYAEANQKLRNQ